MSAVVANELERFHQFVEDKLGSSFADLTPDEVMSERRATHPSSTATPRTTSRMNWSRSLSIRSSR